MGLCEFRVLSHLTAESKVSQFHMVSLINEDIGRFDVPMQHLTPSPSLISRPCMAVFKCQQQLVTYLPDNFLLYLSLSLLGLFQLSPEIATRAVLHDDVYLGGSFVHHAIDISHDVRVVQFFQEVDLCDQLLLLPTAHLLEIDLFPHQDLATLFGTHFSDYSEGALADLFERDVLVHLNFQQQPLSTHPNITCCLTYLIYHTYFLSQDDGVLIHINLLSISGVQIFELMTNNHIIECSSSHPSSTTLSKSSSSWSTPSASSLKPCRSNMIAMKMRKAAGRRS